MMEKQQSFGKFESLSALMDGEAEELEFRRLLLGLPQDTEMRATWSRYQLAVSILHKQSITPLRSLDFANAVRSAIELEALEVHKPAAENSSVWRPVWKKNLLGMATAASVALAIVTGVQWRHQGADFQQIAIVEPSSNVAKHQVSGIGVSRAAPAAALVNQPLTGVARPDNAVSFDLYNHNQQAGKSPNLYRNGAPLAPVASRRDR
jgi:negative regulator of sigma E activity